MKALLVRLGQFSIGSLGSALLNLILIPITTYFLTPTEYGKTSMFFLAQTFLMYVIYLGFDQAYTREFHAYKNKQRLLQNAMLIPLSYSLLLILTIILFSSYVSEWLFASPRYQHAIYLLALSILFMIFERFILLKSRMENRAVTFSFYSILVKFTILLGTIIALWIGSASFITVVYGMLFGQILGDLLLIVLNIQIFQVKSFRIDFALLEKMAHFALPIVVATFLYSLFIIVDKLFLRYFGDFADLGLYTAAFKVASALMIIQVSFANFWIPTAYEWYEKKKPLFYYKNISDMVMFIVAVLFLIMMLFKKWIVLILSPEYTEAQYIFPMLCFYPLMMTVGETTGLGIAFQKKSHLNIVISCIGLVVSLSLNFLLVPTFGALGAAIATGTVYIVHFLLRTFFSMLVWQGFPIKKHFIVTFLLYVIALSTIFIRSAVVNTLTILLSLFLITGLYSLQIRQLYQFIKREKNNDLEIS
ncbi:lipopolysaccharide biosynthesis protein [Listeria ilorinensis]|uniref:lipopolysaccharide biosynthesis protein n=1 Tax=Listeria ilorinensis TaxID=2867439 RepID=UPI001EF44523|nr:oligosaccharide flippase family protein [Listeria ilorinensis]